MGRWSPPLAVGLTVGLNAMVLGWPALLHALPLKLFLGWAAYQTNSTRASFLLNTAANVTRFGGVQAAGNCFMLMIGMTNRYLALLAMFDVLAFALGVRTSRRSTRSAVGASRPRGQ